MNNNIDTAHLLRAALEHRLQDLAAHTGLSARHLADLAEHLIDDPGVVAAHPTECGRLRARRDYAGLTRGRRWQARIPEPHRPAADEPANRTVLAFPGRPRRVRLPQAA